MINIWFAIRNPFKHSEFKNLGCTTGPICENKSWEVQISKYAYNILEFNLDLNWKGEDHAGPSFEINLFGYTLNAKIYDHRHWSHEKHDWEVYEPEQTV